MGVKMYGVEEKGDGEDNWRSEMENQNVYTMSNRADGN
jgi:hypothetical protein